MANANAPRGLIPYRRVSGEPYNSAGNLYYVPASNGTALYVGDPVVLVTASADIRGCPAVGIASAGTSNNILGAVMGVIPGGTPQIPVLQSQPVYLPANTAGYLLVCDDPDALYEIQENGNMGGATPVAGAVPGPGKNANLVAGAGSNTTGFSGWQLNSGTLNTTNTLQMRVLRMLDQADNSLGANAKWLCRINLNQLTSTTGT